MVLLLLKNKARRFLINVVETQRLILEQEDTDGDFQITVNDLGPKMLSVGTADSGGYLKYQIRGTYMLSNLLQELALANDYGRTYIVIDEDRLNENPVDRLSRRIRLDFWDRLVRTIDAEGLEVICTDPKTQAADYVSRIYVPFDDTETYEYYTKLAGSKKHLNLEVEQLPKEITAEYVKSINKRPGILSLAMYHRPSDTGYTLSGVPFLVPGGRFNEMYGWDSYFIVLGLLQDDHVERAKNMVDNLVYQIKYYGKILNANRSYYLMRSQPPFLTDMAVKIYERLDAESKDDKKTWIKEVILAAIKEYHTVWMAEPRLDKKTMLSRYRPGGLGIPPETEPSHFDHILAPFAQKHQLSILAFVAQYNNQEIQEPALDEYLMHDRAVRESGHDTTYRFDRVCANLATIDLNALLYKYEMDIADCITDYLDDDLLDDTGQTHTGIMWLDRAKQRKERIDKYLWNESEGLYFDYDTVKECQTTYESVTTFWAMWAGCASHQQAEHMVRRSLSKFEVTGGLVSGTEESRGNISIERPNRQWDFPFGWAPHQIMAWAGFKNYEMDDIAQRLAYRWLYTIIKGVVDFNGVVPEKFDVVSLSHKVEVEYGNVGTDFKYVSREGFGWMNASYQIGLSYLTRQLRRALGACIDPDQLFEKHIMNQSIALSPEEAAEARLRRRNSFISAKVLTQNGSVTAAVTRISAEPNPSSSNCFLSPVDAWRR
ncbi:alpha,alpha-trehalase nth1 [Apophysomyces sp. BC1034]|nr:alpha,alpha-trehalase nth1 [Apophysomyces sp. BC1015]KAG0181252.1 alpha,alpha-trehalase nth1 [Apophysomyces sp. BC1021]KAG0193107.1 alpha,alpha-trehalase nth1 [Apophysomyces sp. BC1034]